MLERDIFLGDTNKMVILVDYYNNDLREKDLYTFRAVYHAR